MDYKEYSELCDLLAKWAEAYAAGESKVEDVVYDTKYLELKKFEAEHPAFILATSPTRRVIDGAEGFRKVKHTIPMISIANSNGIEETVEWASGMFKNAVAELELEYKIDGLGLALIYSEGQFIDAITRGVDNVGDSVWENALRIASIPKTIPLKGKVEIRGEVVWKFDDFEKFNDQLEADGKKLISNPRNGAAGTLKSHDPLEVEKRNLSYIAYLIVDGSPNRLQSDDIKLLEGMGFEVPPHSVARNLIELREQAESMRDKRYDQAYPIDGVVLKVNDKNDQKRFGMGTKSPNYFRAYKFPPEEKVTVLRMVEQSGGMSGHRAACDDQCQPLHPLQLGPRRIPRPYRKLSCGCPQGRRNHPGNRKVRGNRTLQGRLQDAERHEEETVELVGRPPCAGKCLPYPEGMPVLWCRARKDA